MTTTMYPPSETLVEGTTPPAPSPGRRSVTPARPGAIGSVPIRATVAETPHLGSAGPEMSDAESGDIETLGVRRSENRPRRNGGEINRIDPRIARRRFEIRTTAETVRRRKRIALRGGAGLLVTAAVVVLSPVLGVRRIQVQGVVSGSEQQRLRDASGVTDGTPLIRISTGAVRHRLEQLPDIASARVTKHWFRGLSIAVLPERAVARIAGRTNTALVGANGDVIRNIPTPALGGYAQLPLILGVAPASLGRHLTGSSALIANIAAALGPATQAKAEGILLVDGNAVVRLRDIAAPAKGNGGSGANSAANVAAPAGATGPAGSKTAPFEASFGVTTDVPLKARALEALVVSGSLDGYRAVDLGVPDAPILRR
jgi:POTRA domain, FtsQ-type